MSPVQAKIYRLDFTCRSPPGKGLRRAVLPARTYFGFCLKIRLNSPVTQSAQTVYPKAYFAFLSLNLSEKIGRKSLFYGNWPLYPRFARKAALQRRAKFSVLVANSERPGI
ncbi:hypothetical protein [uncultured Campylobacter sp.]|uniref:hypothetical protein n=1 Tax=uncultured Campylobacter sp. TaxID=218934 RepID=UPI00262518DA|nr:hypothetical protein [uncultured Campylobacter sp.]